VAALKRTPLRHRMLAEADTERLMRVWVDMARTRTMWRWRNSSDNLTAAESRALGELDRAGLLYVNARLGPSVGAPQRVELSREGILLRREWSKEHGDPLADPGAPPARPIPNNPEVTP
jgi:hypothetical protein